MQTQRLQHQRARESAAEQSSRRCVQHALAPLLEQPGPASQCEAPENSNAYGALTSSRLTGPQVLSLEVCKRREIPGHSRCSLQLFMRDLRG
jgi:hypothetical protein